MTIRQGYVRLAVLTLLSIGVLFFAWSRASAQETSVTDQGTPSALARGAHPLGSYGGGDIDIVNLFNGNLSLRIPLAAKDGRAMLGASVLLSYNSKIWRSTGTTDTSGNTSYIPTIDPWDPTVPEIAPGWTISPGRMVERRSGKGTLTLNNCPVMGANQDAYHDTFTVLTFTAPDGTEYTFRDAYFSDPNPSPYRHDGDFHAAFCGGYARGQVWYANDGTAATFLSDAVINDQTSRNADTAGELSINGYVFLRDGTRFRIDNDLVSWQEDTNGNRVNFTYTNQRNGRSIVIRDTLDRLITVNFYYHAPSPSEQILVEVVVTDADGLSRTTTVYGRQLESIRDDGVTSAPTYGQLFGSGTFAVLDSQPFDPELISRVELPHDTGMPAYNYSLSYNIYGEVSRVDLPTRGRMEYTHGGGEGANQYGVMGNYNFYRRVKTRTTYTDGTTTTIATKTRYHEDLVPDAPGSYSRHSVIVERFLNADDTINGAVVHTFVGTPLDNNFRSAGVPLYSGQKPWMEGKEVTTQYLDSGGMTNLRQVDYTWVQRAGTWYNTSTTDADNFENDPRLAKVTTTVYDYAATPLVSKVSYNYDDSVPYNNVSATMEYDWGSGAPGSLLRETDRTYEDGSQYTTPIAATMNYTQVVHLRSLVKTEIVKATGSPESETDYTYDETSGTFHAPLVARGDLTNSDAVTKNHDGTLNPTTRALYRGNVTTVKKGLSPDAYSTTYHQYDDCGNVVKTYWPRAPDDTTNKFATDYTFDATNKYAYIVQSKRYVNQQTSGAPTLITLMMSRTYYFDTGQLKTATGENGELGSYYYHDALGRLTHEDLPDGSYNTLYYSPPNTTTDQYMLITSKLDSNGPGGAARETWKQTTFDGLGRTTFSTRSDVGSSTVSVETRFDVRGRPYLVSNPIRSTDSLTVSTRGWTRTTYDGLNRVRYVDSLTDLTDGLTAPTGFTGRVTTEYSKQPPSGQPYSNKPSVLVTDQAGRQRKTFTDGLGRIAYVLEAPDDTTNYNFLTSYTYDARSDLMTVTQGSQTPRQFTYDSLGRMKTASMPECDTSAGTPGGVTSYSYDQAGNATMKTDAEGVSVTTSFDELNRPLNVDYSNTPTNPDITHVYDGSILPSPATDPSFARTSMNGRLYAVVTFAAGSTNQELTGAFYSYDASGRVTHYSEMLGTSHYESTPNYNEQNLLTSESYNFPGSSNATRVLTYNEAGQISQVKRGSAIVDDAVTYSPGGALAAERYGDQTLATSLYHTIAYNSRLQSTSILLGNTAGGDSVLGLRYTYGTQPAGALQVGSSIDTTSNNGNLARLNITPVVGQPYYEQDFAYDKVNRIATATEFQTSGDKVACGATVAPATPTGLTATGSATSVSLSWTEPAGNIVCSFDVRRGSSSSGTFVSVGTTNGTTTTFTDSGLPQGNYCYVIVAINNIGQSPQSSAACATVSACGVAAPSNLTAVNVNGIQVNLAWTDNSSNETGFRIEKEDITNTQPYSLVTTTAANVTTFADTNVAPNTTYRYRVAALPLCADTVWAVAPDVTTTPSDNAIKLSGTSQYGAADGSGAGAGLSVTGNITVEAWIVMNQKDITQTIASKHSFGSSEGGYVLSVTNTNQLSFTTFTSTGAIAASLSSPSGTPLTPKVWHHVVGEYASGAGVIAVYVDGVRTYNTVGSGLNAAATTSALQIGRALKSDGTATKYFWGKIDELRISNVFRYGTATFTPTKDQPVPPDANVIGLWKMNATSGTTAADSTTHGYTVNLYNGVTWTPGVTTNYIYKHGKRSHAGAANGGTGEGEAGGGDVGMGDKAQDVLTYTQLWTQVFSYDQWGNMKYGSGTTAGLSHTLVVDTARNRVTQVDGQTTTYYKNGNVKQETTADPPYDVQHYDYDADERLYQTTYPSNASRMTVKYVYNGLGQRVKKIVGSATTSYVYNAAGAVVAEFAGATRSKEYLYGAGGMLATVQSPGAGEAIEYCTPDNLGTPRVITYGTGSVGTVKSRHDYLPFGGEIPNTGAFGRGANNYGVADDVTHKFTSKERDADTNLDYFGARYYSASQGRFTGLDISGPELGQPQTLNKYRYALNNPMRFRDPNGKYEEDVHRDLTVVLALAAGFDRQLAGNIGGWDQRVDDDLPTSPWDGGQEAREAYHFTSPERRASMLGEFEQNLTTKSLGYYLHAEQDSYSHDGKFMNTWTGHLPYGHGPDKTYNDPKKALSMAEDTYVTLVQALNAMYGGNAKEVQGHHRYATVAFSMIEADVQAFNTATTEAGKRLALANILDTILKERQRSGRDAHARVGLAIGSDQQRDEEAFYVSNTVNPQ